MIALLLVIVIFVLLVIIAYLYEKYKEIKSERDILLSNIKNLKKREDDYRHEIDSIKWNNEIQNKTKFNVEYKPNKKLKILIGDYMSETLTNTNSVLNSLGIETEVVPSGEDIVRKIENGEKFDVIITNNIYKTHLDGTGVLYELKDIPKFKTPVIVLTVSQDKREYFINECGFDEYMTKALTQDKAIKGLTSVIKGLKFNKISK